MSHGSSTTEESCRRESLGSDTSAYSRASSASFHLNRNLDVGPASHGLRQRLSADSYDAIGHSKTGGAATRRRGYMRPLGTDFAASARQRESVLSLGSITHLQHYFARTGLLDGKGGQLARKRRQKAHTLDLTDLDASSFLTPGKAMTSSDHDSSYASMGSSPDLGGHGAFGGRHSGPGVQEEGEAEHDDEYLSDDYDEIDAGMLPPTQSTYNYREKPVPKPPSIAELKADLTSALDTAATALQQVRHNQSLSPPTSPNKASPRRQRIEPCASPSQETSPPAWHEIQGVHILDVLTLAIRAAKMYYTAHENPDRLDALKSEKALRAELLLVMDVLKRMATRGFAGGMRNDELRTMEEWIASLRSLLADEDTAEAAERAERASWTWLRDDGWASSRVGECAREEAFLRSMLVGAPDPPVAGMHPLPTWEPIEPARLADAPEQHLPTPFLAHLASGVRLVQLHNCAVRKSRRRFGAIPSFHADTQKPYRAADNLRYWFKAAELRWEVLLPRIDPLALQRGADAPPAAWLEFEVAVLAWCRRVREEIAAEVQC